MTLEWSQWTYLNTVGNLIS